jgi:hypothetical protein
MVERAVKCCVIEGAGEECVCVEWILETLLLHQPTTPLVDRILGATYWGWHRSIIGTARQQTVVCAET